MPLAIPLSPPLVLSRALPLIRLLPSLSFSLILPSPPPLLSFPHFRHIPTMRYFSLSSCPFTDQSVPNPATLVLDSIQRYNRNGAQYILKNKDASLTSAIENLSVCTNPGPLSFSLSLSISVSLSYTHTHTLSLCSLIDLVHALFYAIMEGIWRMLSSKNDYALLYSLFLQGRTTRLPSRSFLCNGIHAVICLTFLLSFFLLHKKFTYRPPFPPSLLLFVKQVVLFFSLVFLRRI
jgi:hypothetical protein